MSGKKRAWIIGIFISLFAGPAAAYYTFREDPQIAAFKEARSKLRDKELTPELRKQYEQQAGAAWEKMGPEKQISYERQRFDNDRMRQGIERYNKEMDDFLALDPKERKKKLQEEIKAEEKRAKDRAAERAKRDAENAQLAAAGGAGGSGGGQGNRGGGGGGGRGPGRGNPQQQRLSLDFQSSSSRAKADERSREKQITRVQMGLPAESPRGGRGGGRR
jgi:hypothetical protein